MHPAEVPLVHRHSAGVIGLRRVARHHRHEVLTPVAANIVALGDSVLRWKHHARPLSLPAAVGAGIEVTSELERLLSGDIKPMNT